MIMLTASLYTSIASDEVYEGGFDDGIAKKVLFGLGDCGERFRFRFAALGSSELVLVGISVLWG